MIVKPNRDRRAERHEAIRREILDAAWDAAHETSIAGLTLRDIATRVGMQQPSLYSHFASKQAIYDAMFKQAWQTYLDDARSAVGGLPAEPRPRLIAIAEHYFDFAVADLPRHQLMDVNVVPNFQPSPRPTRRPCRSTTSCSISSAAWASPGTRTPTSTPRSSAAWSTSSSPTTPAASGGAA